MIETFAFPICFWFVDYFVLLVFRWKFFACLMNFIDFFCVCLVNFRLISHKITDFIFVTAFLGRYWEPSVLIEGVLFRARYLGSTQLVCEGQPTKSTRMMQAEEAVSRIKVQKFILSASFEK